MSQKLSYTSIFATLATLGAVACGGSAPAAESPVEAKEVPATATEAAPAEVAADAAPPEAPAEAAAPAAPAAPTAEAPAATPAAQAPAKPAPAPAHKKKAAGAKAGCGAGTCG